MYCVKDDALPTYNIASHIQTNAQPPIVEEKREKVRERRKDVK